MQNMSYELDDDGLLTITVDTTKSFGPSTSGKSIIVASSGGAAAVDAEGLMVNLNVYRSAKRK